MDNFQKLKSGFLAPDSEFSPIPFWFLNDALDEGELLSQLNVFYAKGIRGVVLHPRMGIPSDTPYLGEKYMNFIRICVNQACELKMKVILYDEGMYPSGSAGGLVAKLNPRYRSRGIYAVRMITPRPFIPENEKLVGEYLLKFENNRLSDFVRREDSIQRDGYIPYAFICGYTNGKIRGVHPQTDDFEAKAPFSGDLLSPPAVDAFIELTHERYFGKLEEFFGSTIIGFFTDEPNVTGRRSEMPDYAAWTEDFLGDFIAQCDGEELLPMLLFEGEKTKTARAAHKKAVSKRLAENYYGKLSKWCREHNLYLFGHPGSSADIGLQKYFCVPGQDIVWRGVEASHNLTSPDSVAAKCSSDSARHLARRRNSNEVFGVCGEKDNPWDFTFSDMLWYLNFLFVRGVNLIFPHAFYYSVRTPLQYSERPPDVGPNNIWWEDYSAVSSYISRLSYLNTDCRNSPLCAVLCSWFHMPYKIVKPLYENQFPFNYITEEMIDNGKIESNGYKYDTLLIDNEMEINDALRSKLDLFSANKGRVLFLDDDNCEEYFSVLDKNTKRDFFFLAQKGDKSFLRIEKLIKEDCAVYLLGNESAPRSGNTITGELTVNSSRRIYRADGFSGQFIPIFSKPFEGGSKISLSIPPCRLMILVESINEVAYDDNYKEPEPLCIRFADYDEAEASLDKNGFPERLYTANLHLADRDSRIVLTLPEVRDKAKIYINNIHVDTLLLPPWETDITDFVYRGDNSVQVRVTGSAANRFGEKTPVGLIKND